MLAKREISPTAATVEFNDSLSGSDLSMHPKLTVQKKANKKRFTNEQIKFLESMYQSESRPQSQRKQQLATKLGIQPYQVAIWFQNRRARLKTKQIERGYKILKGQYDALTSNYESLKRENESLLTQLQHLQRLQTKHQMSRQCQMSQTESSSDGRIETKTADPESKEQPSLTLKDYGHGPYGSEEDMHSRGDKSITVERTMEETDFFNNLAGYTDCSLTSSGWDRFDSNCFLDESSCSLQWWELLS